MRAQCLLMQQPSRKHEGENHRQLMAEQETEGVGLPERTCEPWVSSSSACHPRQINPLLTSLSGVPIIAKTNLNSTPIYFIIFIYLIVLESGGGREKEERNTDVRKKY